MQARDGDELTSVETGERRIDSVLSGIVRANSFTLPKCQNRISRPLIFLYFSGSILAVRWPPQVFRILL
jgi:hypothetical protein